MSAVAQETYPIPKELRSILRPQEDLTVSEWCDKYRKLHSRQSAMPGWWSTAYTPYLREPLDAFADPGVELIVFMKCSRIGGTETLNNILAFAACCRPMPTLYVQPEKEDCEEELRGRIKLMYEGMDGEPRLPILIPPHLRESGYWARGTRIELTTMDIYGAWMTNHGTLKRRTIGVIAVDEIDNAEAVAGRLGNTVDFLLERTATYGHRAKVFLDGTPTFEDASGWQALLNSDHRKPYVPCPRCGTYQVLKFTQIKLKPAHEHERDPDKIRIQQLAGYECEAPECKAMIEHGEHHRWMIDRTVWVPSRVGPDKKPAQVPAEKLPLDDAEIVAKAQACGQHPGDGHVQWKPRLEGDAPLTRRRGYWINVLYSPWRSRTWSHILAKFFECKHDREKLRVFNNSWLGEPWRDAIVKTDLDALKAKREKSYPPRVVPAAAKILLMGADVQGNEIYFVIRAWGPWERSWLIYEERCATFEQLYEIAFYTGYEVAGTEGKELMRCHALAIDSAHRTDEVYEFAQRPGVVAVKGLQSGAFRTRPSKIEHHPNGLPLLNPLTLQHVNTNYFKTHIARLMNLPAGDRSYWALHAQTQEDYLEHCTNEHQVRMRVGPKNRKKWEIVWTPKSDGAAVDWFDAEVYGAALADMVKVPLLREHSEKRGLMSKGERKAPAKEAVERTPPTPREPGRGWLR